MEEEKEKQEDLEEEEEAEEVALDVGCAKEERAGRDQTGEACGRELGGGRGGGGGGGQGRRRLHSSEECRREDGGPRVCVREKLLALDVIPYFSTCLPVASGLIH